MVDRRRDASADQEKSRVENCANLIDKLQGIQVESLEIVEVLFQEESRLF